METAELIRAYGELIGSEATAATVASRQEPTGNDAELAHLREQVAALEARLADKQQHIEHLAQAMHLLEHRSTPESIHPRRSWWPYGRK